MKSLRECLREAQEKKVAIGHFNVSNLEAVWGIFRAARNLNVPVIIGLSEGERDFFGLRQAQAVIKSLREEYDFPIFLNADHSYSFLRVKEAVEAGFDAAIFDGAELSFEENIKITKESVDFARHANPEILIEGELGYIGKSSKLLDSVPEGVGLNKESLTSPEAAREFVSKTGVDLFAPAVGNMHGMLKGGHDPALDIERIRAVREACGVPLVLHGGSGNSDDDFRKAIAAGVSIIHINTELRLAFKQALILSLDKNREEISPYKYLKPAAAAVEKAVENKLKVFNNL